MSRLADDDVLPPGARDGGTPNELADPSAAPEPELPDLDGSLAVLRQGLEAAPEFRSGLRGAIVLAMLSAVGRLTVPLLFQQILDRGVRDGDLRVGFVTTLCVAAFVVVGVVLIAQRFASLRLWISSESALAGLRTRTFAHIHRLSISVQNEEKRGALVSRVTNDVDTIAQFLEWGGISWIVCVTLMVGAFAAMLVCSWQLALIALAMLLPLVPILRFLQRGMVRAYDRVRSRVSDTLTHISEVVMGAAVVRAYGVEERTTATIDEAIDAQYQQQVRANAYSAVVFPTGDLIGSTAMATVIGLGAWLGPDWGLTSGRLVAMVFLVALFLEPLAELSESFDQTQNAIAGFRKILGVLALPVEVPDPEPGVELDDGALDVRVDGVSFHYGSGGPLVLDDVSVYLPAGSHVAVVGETGSGKTTFAKLLCRLADPVGGAVVVGGRDLRQVSGAARRRSIRLVPQDGFLFDVSIRENIRLGRPDATDAEIDAAFGELGLDDWVARLPAGLDTRVGERGDSMSVGERQLVALARAQVASPGLLILDEATSAVDPDTEQAIARALARLGEGRTTVAIAHRLSTAEAADLVLVFDQGHLVEQGAHAELVALGGRYAALYDSWLGNTKA
ncbi:MAG: ABC transporter ATP-binding protein [Ilumatobacteraceae bacterium]